MAKPISISWGKPKLKPPGTLTSTSTPSGTEPASSSLPPPTPPRRPALTADPEDDAQDDTPPVHETVLGFAADGGAILGRPVGAKEERVIANKGNADWRTRGRPARVTTGHPEGQDGGQAGRRGTTTVETEETGTKAGLQFAENVGPAVTAAATATVNTNGHKQDEHIGPRAQPQSADEAALSALLSGDQGRFLSTKIIQQPQSATSAGATTATGLDETLDFRNDVASRPDPATLEEYAEMPVEEFGMALLRGMGKKRRANGEVIVIKNPHETDPEDKKKDKTKMRDPNMGYLGIGAKAAKRGSGTAGDDGLGAWGKMDMRKIKKGEGLYTPVMLRDRRTGELITEAELEERKKSAKEAAAAGTRETRDEEDWRDRRDRNLDRNRLHGGGGGGAGGDGRHRDTDTDDSRRRHHHHHRDAHHLNGPSRKMIQDTTTTTTASRHDASRHPSSSSRRRSRRTTSRSRSRDRDRDHDSRAAGGGGITDHHRSDSDSDSGTGRYRGPHRRDPHNRRPRRS